MPDQHQLHDTAAVPTAEDARRALTGHLPIPSPISSSDSLDNAWGFHAWFKLEMLFTTGSFKERGARYKLSSLTAEERSRGVIAASAGNHAQALAFHARALGIPCTIVMPENAPLIKVRNTSGQGARVILHGCDYDSALEQAKQLAEEENNVFISGFDDPWIIAGQGTVGLELLEECEGLDCVIVPVGGGGLIAGIATAIKQRAPHVRVIGVQARACPSARAAL